MDDSYYPYERPITEIRYDFKSISQEKEVRKRVIFTTSDYQNFYNLALVDVMEDGSLSDLSESRNKDMTTILATVIRVVEDFFESNTDKIILFRGSDERRQRLYRLIINRDLSKIQKKFSIFGGMEDAKAELFVSNKVYDYFIILKKSTSNEN